MPGPPPKPASKRRRYNKPASYGLAEPTVAGDAAVQPRLGFRAHKLVTAMWKALGGSVEAQFFSTADWQRARWECWYANQLMTGQQALTANGWNVVQAGLSELLVSPAINRRCGIELKAAGVDADEVAAAAQVGEYRQRLSSLKSV